MTGCIGCPATFQHILLIKLAVYCGICAPSTDLVGTAVVRPRHNPLGRGAHMVPGALRLCGTRSTLGEIDSGKTAPTQNSPTPAPVAWRVCHCVPSEVCAGGPVPPRIFKRSWVRLWVGLNVLGGARWRPHRLEVVRWAHVVAYLNAQESLRRELQPELAVGAAT